MTGPVINNALAVIVDSDELERIVRETVRDELQTGGAVVSLPEWFGAAAEVAAYLGIGASTVEKKSAEGSMPVHKVGKKNVWNRAELDAAVKAGSLE